MSNKFTLKDIKESHERIKPYIYKTPLERSICYAPSGKSIFYKLECLQSVRAFKIRGAMSKMTSLSEEEKSRGVATISSGNHGAAVSFGASQLGIKNAVVIVPETTPTPKVDRIKHFGAQVLLMGKDYDEAHIMGAQYLKDRGLTYIDAYDADPMVYSGQGTMAIEILDQNPDIDTIIVPIGGGCMATGISVAAKGIKPSINVIGVQTKACPAMVKSLEENVLYVEYPTQGESICDALLGGIGRLAFEMLPSLIDDIVTVNEQTIQKAVAHMIKNEKYIVEPAGAVTLAALMEHGDSIPGKNISLIMSGGNIATELMMDVMNAV